VDDLMTRADTAAMVKRTPDTLREWARRDYGPPITRIGRTPYYRRASVLAWIAAQEASTQDASPTATDAA
jgi:hypothetical protein